MNATRVCPSNRATEPLSSTFVLQPTMPSRRKEPVRAESPVGSGMSPEALANDKARQPRLLAAAAVRKRVSPVAKTIQKAKTGKKVIDLSSLISPTSSASSSSKSGYKEAHAVFTLVKAKFQKGEKKDEYSGAIYFRGKPRYGNNEIFKAKVGDKLLAETLRWNDEFKLYSAKVYTAEQAQMVLDAMRMVSEKDERDLASVTVDETIFDDAHRAEIKIFPLEVEGDGNINLNLAIAGTTYPFNKILKQAGFTFHNVVNGEPLKLWLREESDGQPEVDAGDLEEMFKEYGFTVDKYDGVAEDDETV